MTISTWRNHVRKAHGLASTGDRTAVERLGHLMRHKRKHELKPAKSTREHSDDAIWEMFISQNRNRLATALKLGYSTGGLSKRLRPIIKQRTINP